MARSKTGSCIIYAVLIIATGALLYTFGHCAVNYAATQINAPDREEVNKQVSLREAPDWLNISPSHTQLVTMDTQWVRDVKHAVEQLAGRQVTLLVSNNKYLDVLVNWLVHSVLFAFQPVNNILIISFDTFTHLALCHKGFLSVYIPKYSIMQSRNFSSRFSHIWITRLTVMRLLNHWNYNVLLFDSDAILLKDIWPLLDRFDDSDIISSSGTYPFLIHHEWGVPTVCMGVFLIKNSAATELFWYVMRSLSTTDDQARVNRALDNMGIQWKLLNDEKYYQGITHGPTSLRVTTLPTSLICRNCKESLFDNYYVWHLHAKKEGSAKRDQLAASGLWILQDDWNRTLWDTQTGGKRWLFSIIKQKT